MKNIHVSVQFRTGQITSFMASKIALAPSEEGLLEFLFNDKVRSLLSKECPELIITSADGLTGRYKVSHVKVTDKPEGRESKYEVFDSPVVYIYVTELGAEAMSAARTLAESQLTCLGDFPIWGGNLNEVVAKHAEAVKKERMAALDQWEENQRRLERAEIRASRDLQGWTSRRIGPFGPTPGAYVVINYGASLPTREYSDRTLAVAEAKRLSQLNPHQRFYVMYTSAFPLHGRMMDKHEIARL